VTILCRNCATSLVKGLEHATHPTCRIVLNLEIPDSNDCPAGIGKLPNDATVPLAISLDLLVPEFAGLTPVVVRVPVPEGAVYKDGNTPPDPCEVRAPRNIFRMQCRGSLPASLERFAAPRSAGLSQR
jgi:hypothetical protein